jgi:hypothetical protein
MPDNPPPSAAIPFRVQVQCVVFYQVDVEVNAPTFEEIEKAARAQAQKEFIGCDRYEVQSFERMPRK